MFLLQFRHENKGKRKNCIYTVFLDVKIAYDKAWLDAILYILDKMESKEKLGNHEKNETPNKTYSPNTDQL